MTDRKFFGTNDLVNDYLQNLDKIETLDGGWTIKYLDKKTNKTWLKYTVDPDRGYYFNLMLTTPPLTTQDIIEIAFTSNYTDEVSAAAHRLNLEEQYEKKKYRQELINRLNQIQISGLNKNEQQRLKTIIEAGQLTNNINRQVTVGDEINEIYKDFDFFDKIAKRATEILTLLNK